MNVIITGIKSDKTKNMIFNRLNATYYPVVKGHKGNYQIQVEVWLPVKDALEEVYDMLTNLTDDHKSNLGWKVKR